MCLNPFHIVNPDLVSHFKRFDVLVMGSLDRQIPLCNNGIWTFPRIYPVRYILRDKSISYLDRFYALNFTTGECMPVFIEVPCRKCIDCLQSKVTSLKNRMLLEQYFTGDDLPPYHLTLTYSDEHLPKQGVQREHISLFLNRLHLYLSRNGFPSDFRHALFSEYSPQRHRAHYHCVLFNVPRILLDDFNEFLRYRDVIRQAWPYGFICFKQIPVDKIQYVAKYVIKDSLEGVPVGKLPNFFNLSRRFGGLGCRSVLLSELRRLFSGGTRVALKVLGRVFNVSLPPQLRRRLLASASTIFKVSFYDRIKTFSVFSRAVGFHERFPDLCRRLRLKYTFVNPSYFDSSIPYPTRFDAAKHLASLYPDFSDLIVYIGGSDTDPIYSIDQTDLSVVQRLDKICYDLAQYLLNHDLDLDYVHICNRWKHDFMCNSKPYFDEIKSKKAYRYSFADCLEKQDGDSFRKSFALGFEHNGDDDGVYLPSLSCD